MAKEENKSLYDIALDTLIDEESIDIKQIIESSEKSIDKNDLIYALFIQNKVMQEGIEFINKMHGVRHKAIIKKIEELDKDKEEKLEKKIQKHLALQQTTARRLAATLNERKIFVFFFVLSLLTLSILAGIGAYGICSFFNKPQSVKVNNNANYESLLKIEKEIANEE